MSLLRSASYDGELLRLMAAAGENVNATARLLRDLLDSYPERAELAEAIRDREHDGDKIAHDLIHRLNADVAVAAPFNSTDGYALATAIDDIVDYAEEAADRLGLYGIEAPMEQASALADVLVAASAQVGAALAGLATQKDIAAHLVEIHRLENAGDRISREGVGALFAGGIDPMVVIRWKDVFESLESAVDACEHVAHVLEGITLKRR